VGANSKLMLNIAPDNTGRVPDDAVAVYSQFGQWIQSCWAPGVELASVNGTGASLVLTLPYSTIVDRVVIQEDLTNGEQVWAYSVELQDTANGPNAPWQLVGTGTAIGYKRIHMFGSGPTSLTSVRVNATTIATGFDTVSWAWFAAYAPCS